MPSLNLKTFPDPRKDPQSKPPNVGEPTLLKGTLYPDPREDLERRSPNLGPHTTKGTL